LIEKYYRHVEGGKNSPGCSCHRQYCHHPRAAAVLDSSDMS